jgi:MFS family permease
VTLATSAFWLIAVSFLLSQFSQSGVVQNQAPDLEDIGFPVTIAATALGTVGLGSAIGKFFFGWLCDVILPKYACFIGFIFQVSAIVILISIRPTSPVVMIWLYAILMGLGMGSWLPTMSMLASTNFGLASYGTIFGMLSLIQRLGAATGPMVAGYMYDALGNYHWAFIILVSLYAIAVPAILAIRQSKSIK